MWLDEFDSGEWDDDDESSEWGNNLTDGALDSIANASCSPQWRKREEYTGARDYFLNTMYNLVDEFRHNDALSEIEKTMLEDAVTAGFEAIHLSKKVEGSYPGDELAAERENLDEKMREVLQVKGRFAETPQEISEHMLLNAGLKTGLDVERIKYLRHLMDLYSEVVEDFCEMYGEVLIHHHVFHEGYNHEITVSQIEDFEDACKLGGKAIMIASELDGMQAGEEWTVEKMRLVSMLKNIKYAWQKIDECPGQKLIVDDEFYQSLGL